MFPELPDPSQVMHPTSRRWAMSEQAMLFGVHRWTVSLDGSVMEDRPGRRESVTSSVCETKTTHMASVNIPGITNTQQSCVGEFWQRNKTSKYGF